VGLVLTCWTTSPVWGSSFPVGLPPWCGARPSLLDYLPGVGRKLQQYVADASRVTSIILAGPDVRPLSVARRHHTMTLCLIRLLQDPCSRPSQHMRICYSGGLSLQCYGCFISLGAQHNNTFRVAVRTQHISVGTQHIV
jgi:hypothetical protein